MKIIKTKTITRITTNINDIEGLNKDFKEYLTDFQNGFFSELLFNGEQQFSRLYTDDLCQYIIELEDDEENENKQFLASLKELLALLLDKDINYITLENYDI